MRTSIRYCFIFILFLAYILCLSCPVFLYASSKPYYVALGDSITKGCGLSTGESPFVELLSEKHHFPSYRNHGVNGFTIEDLRKELKDPTIADEVKNASFLSITIGGNDVLNLIRSEASAITNKNFKNTEKVPSAAKNKQFGKLISYYVKTPKVQKKINHFIANFQTQYDALIKEIRTLNPSSPLSIQTIYNPLRQSEYDGMTEVLDELLIPVNESIKNITSQYPSIYLTDTFSLFLENTPRFVRSNEKDIHPTKEGHIKIANAIYKDTKNARSTLNQNVTNLTKTTNRLKAFSPHLSITALLFITFLFVFLLFLLIYSILKHRK